MEVMDDKISNSVLDTGSHVCFYDSECRTDNFNCGVCSKTFDSICQLHDHLQRQHASRGCYHYNSSSQTAFPKYETVCCFTQTVDDLDVEVRPADSWDQLCSLYTCKSTKRRSRKKKDIVIPVKTVLTSESVGLKEVIEEVDKKTHEKDTTSVSKEVDFKSVFESGVKSCAKKENKANPENISGIHWSAKPTNCVKSKKVSIKRVKIEKAVDKLKTAKTLPSKATVKKPKTKLPITLCRKKSRKSLKNKLSLPATVAKQLSSSEIQSSALKMENIDILSVINAKCPLCSEVVMRENLKHHMKSNHSEQITLNCQFCPHCFTSQDDLDKHIAFEHSSTETSLDQENNMCVDLNVQTESGKKTKKFVKKNEDSKSPYTCDQCGHVMPWNKKDVHQRLHSGERPFICHLCGKGLISQDKLKRHMLIHSEVKKHTCEMCGAGFQMKYKLRMHMHIHTGKKPYLCSICGAEFNHSANLATHTRCVHLQIKPYECTVCGGRYAKRSQLDDHALSHSSERQFTCRFCGKSFKYLKGMKRHEKNHVDDQDISCEKCDSEFTRREDYAEHINTVHSPSTMKCAVCTKIFYDKDEFKEHQATQCDSRKYQCSVCGEYYKVCNQYCTHMLAAHGIDRETAELLNTQSKQPNDTGSTFVEQHHTVITPVITISGTNAQRLDTIKASNTLTHQSFSVRQMVTGLLDDDRSTISALTRAATENLRLHSQDIQEEEKMGAIMTPLNPLIALDRRQDQNNYSVSGDSTLIDNSRAPIDAVSAMHMSRNIHMETEHSSLAVVSRDGLILPDRNSDRISLINMNETPGISNDGGFMGRIDARYQSVNAMSLIPISTTITTGQAALLEHERNMALRRLAENNDSQDVTQTLLTGSDARLVQAGQNDRHGNQSEPHSASIGYQIQNLY